MTLSDQALWGVRIRATLLLTFSTVMLLGSEASITAETDKPDELRLPIDQSASVTGEVLGYPRKMPLQRQSGGRLFGEFTGKTTGTGPVSAKVRIFGQALAFGEGGKLFDPREAWLRYQQPDGDLTVGYNILRWGAMDFVSPVDFINQRDWTFFASNPEKLGQPLIRWSRIFDLIRIDMLYLPYFRSPTYADVKNRMGPEVPISEGSAVFDRSRGRWAPSFAARVDYQVGNLVVGTTYGYGYQRDPAHQTRYETALQGGVPVVPPVAAVPYYATGHKIGAYSSYLWDAIDMTFRAEVLYVTRAHDRQLHLRGYGTGAVGFEKYLPAGLLQDLSTTLVMEYVFDSRRRNATTPFYATIVAGLNVDFNDKEGTRLSLSALTGINGFDQIYDLDLSRRLNDDTRLSLVGRYYANIDKNNLLRSLEHDHYVGLRVHIRY